MEEKNIDKMKSIIDKMTSNSSLTDIKESAGGKFEFQFNTPAPKTGLVFEESEDAEAPDEEELFDVFSQVAPEEEISSVPETLHMNSEQEEKTRELDDEEFIIPDVFDIAAASEANPADEYVSTIWKAYVPRFTEVTENKCHFADNSALNKKAQEMGAESASEIIKSNSNKGQVKISVREVTDTYVDSSDPTAEIEAVIPEAIVVNVNGNKSSQKDTMNIFKFSEDKDDKKPEILSDEEIEKNEISDLTGHKWNENALELPECEEDEAKSEVSLTEEAKPESEPSYEPSYVYTEESLEEQIAVSALEEYKNEEKEPLPEGYEGKETHVAANDTSEYNSFSMRDSFKDKFLDSIMAVKIRLSVAILLAIVTFVFDLFQIKICDYLGLGMSFGIPAIIDACLVGSLFLLTLPEICRAIKHLFFGNVTPELSTAIAGVSIFAYAVVMASIAPVGGGYPLFASIYAVMAINCIFATYCLHSSNFSAFKLISEKGNKSVIDKPLTRTLELENIALDGVVDEYKSRCARVFDTPFVSKFYTNASKSAEKTKNNLIILAVSFGVALVGGAVMFFIEGPISALSTFALVISFSIPAFSILSHKLPYNDVQKDSILDNSAVIGEKALIDYSAVDVVVFEDTEVFGPDDVTLKSASDRRSDYLDTMKKMASLFAALGGPLKRVFENTLNKQYAPAKNVEIEDDGVLGTVEGECVMAGTAEYMRRHGVKIPSTGDIKVGSTRIIYAASEGEFFATFTVHYSFSEEFALLLSSMKERDITPLVYTRDFNINNEFMRMLTGGSDVIRVMRKYTPMKEKTVYSKINSAMVTRGDKTSAINLILSSKRYAQFQSLIGVIELSACAAGATLAILIAIGNMTASLPMIVLALWQLGWSVALAIMSKKTFTVRKKENKNAEE